jgi:hypothetical protein
MTLRRSTGFLNKLGGNKTNIISNGTFTTDTTGWTAGGSTLSVVSNRLNIANSGAAVGSAYQDVATVIGRIYKVSFDFLKGTGVSGSVLIGTTASPSAILTSPAYTDATATNKELAFVATETTTRITLQNNSTTGSETALFDNVVVDEILDGFQEIFRNCRVAVYTGTQPASADAVKTGTKLYTLSKDGLGVDGLTWGEAVSGVVSKTVGEAWKGTAIAAGVAGWFRCYQFGDDPDLASTTMARFDGAIATSGAEVNMSNTTIELDAVQTATSFTYTQPAS